MCLGIGTFVATGSAGLAAGTLLLSLIICLAIFRRAFPSIDDVIRLVNVQFPQLEYSMALTTEKVDGLAAVQQHKVISELASLKASVKYPMKWWPVLTALGLGILIAGMKPLLQQPNASEQTAQSLLSTEATEEAIAGAPLELEGISTTIYPPAYTNLKRTSSTDPNLKIPQGSRVSIAATFSKPPEEVRFALSNQAPLKMSLNNEVASISLPTLSKGFYTLQYTDGSDTLSSPYYAIEVISDEPPTIQVDGLEAYQKVKYSPTAGVTLNATIMDDYGLTAAYVTATISKGSGEAVKFREQRLDFDSRVDGKAFTSSMRLNVADFDMEPGNELYFFVTALDNREPEAQATRTETYFFVLEDTTSIDFSLQGNLGVDLMPEYFRSQRQIIIDTEKLIADRGSISRNDFNQTSNELGFDQKALRLRYGQFLGEEDESGIALEAAPEEGGDEGHEEEDHAEDDHTESTGFGANVLQEFGHDHDHEEEDGQLLDKGTFANDAEEIVEKLGHSHDDAETATFYTISMKTKLKAALSVMWDAELHLRLFHPEESLPYQYEALKLIKEIKNHARIYVQRIGFEPPAIPIDEKRLTGDLDEVGGQLWKDDIDLHLRYPHMASAAAAIARVLPGEEGIVNDLQEVLRLAGNELAAIALEEPGNYLETLTMLSSLINTDTFDVKNLRSLARIHRVFLSRLETRESAISSRPQAQHSLLEAFREEVVRTQTLEDQ